MLCCLPSGTSYLVGLGITYIIFKVFRRWIEGAKFENNIRADGKTILITGGSSGIGKAVATELARRGAAVCITSRCPERGQTAKTDIIANSGNENVTVQQLDLSSFESIRNFARTFNEDRLDILINNAGVLSYDRKLTADGLELHIGTNYIGHFLLTSLLLDKLKSSTPSRVLNVSSFSHLGIELEKDDLMSINGYTMIGSYRKSKLAIVLFTKELAKKLHGTGVSTFSLHPGVVDTNMTQDVLVKWPWLRKLSKIYCKIFMKSTEAGVQTTLYCALQPQIEEHSGLYFSDCQLADLVNPSIDDDQLREWLWEQSEKLIKSGKSL